MTAHMSGGRPDGSDWRDFPAGTEMDVADWEADELVRGAQVAVLIPGEPSEPVRLPGVPPGAQEDVTGTEPAAAADTAAAEPGDDAGAATGEPGEPEAEPAVAATGEPPAAPVPSAPKQAWIDYAVAQGADPATAAAMTKADLMSRYGGRL